MRKAFHIAAAILLAMLVFASADQASAQKDEVKDRDVKIEGASPESPVVYLGKSFDKKTGKTVEGYAIVHFDKKRFVKPAPAPDPEPDDPACYGFLAEGAKWITPENWLVDTVNTGGLDSSVEQQIVAEGIGKWETAAGSEILGAGSGGAVSNPKTFGKVINGSNELTFAPIRSKGTIAVTYIWGVFSGDISGRQLVEWDQVYNTYYAWSAESAGVSGKMDFDNIATHELGHSVGLGDLYNTACSTQTMYGYADFGETSKSTLEAGDIAGINILY